MRVILSFASLIVCVAASAGTPAYERIGIALAQGHTLIFYGLNDRDQVLASDCDYTVPTCDLFLWTEKSGKQIIASGQYRRAYLNNAGHVALERNNGVEIWTERAGWTVVPGLTMALLFNDQDMIFGATSTMGLWAPKDGFTPFPTLPAGPGGLYRMNNEGLGVGFGRFEPCAVAMCNDHPLVWSPATGLVDLGVLPDRPSGQASAVNDKGFVAGLLYDAAFSTDRAIFVWTAKDGMQLVGACTGCSQPMAVNKHDEVAGPIYSTGLRTYFWSRSTGLFDIGTLGGRGASMHAMNDRAEIVGESADGHDVWHAFVWSEKYGMIDLTPASWGYGAAINNNGLIMGASADGWGVWKPIEGK
jgi:hypothetical protein